MLTSWTLAWDASRFASGLHGLWDAPSLFPYKHTLAYSDHLLGIALFTAPLQWATGNPVLAYNVAFLASFVFSGAAMYLLARSLTGRADAAAIASLVYAFAPFRASHISHLQWLMLGWLPLSLWALHRYFVTGSFCRLLLAGVFALLQALTATYFMYFALLPLAVVGAAGLRETKRPLMRVVVHAGLVIALMLVAIAPIVRAYYQVRRDYGLSRSMSDIVAQSADVADYVRASPHLRLWGKLGTVGGEHELFSGAVAMLLTAVAVGTRRRSPAIAIYAWIGALAFVLSLGPEPAAWGHGLGVPGPYAWLLAAVPGLDGLRAAARLGVVVLLAMSVLAAFGSTVVLDRLERRWRRVGLAVMLAAIVAEGWAAPIDTPLFDPLGNPAEREAYERLRASPPGAVLELPTSVTDAEAEFRYQYLTLMHGHPVVNGHSGYVTPLLMFLGGGHSPLREPDHLADAVEMVRAIGVRYLLVHRAAFEDATLGDALVRTLDAERQSGRQVFEERRFGENYLVTLTPFTLPEAPPNIRRVDTSAVRASASHSTDRLPFVFDGDTDSRWLTGSPQNGSEWMDLTLDRPRDIRLVRMHVAERSFGDYPRDLAVDVVEAGGVRTLFRGSVLPQFASGLLRSASFPGIDVVLPPNQARGLRLRQLASTRTFFWSIHELQIWERDQRDR